MLRSFIFHIKIHICSSCSNSTSARPVGTACVDDYDGDGVGDDVDICPMTPTLSTTSFLSYSLVDIDSSPITSHSKLPRWFVKNNSLPQVKGIFDQPYSLLAPFNSGTELDDNSIQFNFNLFLLKPTPLGVSLQYNKNMYQNKNTKITNKKKSSYGFWLRHKRSQFRTI